MTKNNKIKHMIYMKQMEVKSKNKAEETLYKELDEQKDNEYIQQIIARYGSYEMQL